MMAVLGAFLGALGVSDLLRASDDDTSARRRITVLAVGLVVLALLLAAGGTTGLDWLLTIPLALALTAWTLGSADALATRTRRSSRLVAFTGLGFGVAISLLLADGNDGQWPAVFSGPLTAIPYNRAVLVLGVALAQLATANVIVRLTLETVGVPTTPGEQRLKSGRVLGSMERLFILGLGMTGAFTAAAAVVAAKGLLRYPDVKADHKSAATGVRPNPVSEYFLIGSFASWLVAVAGLAVVGLDSAAAGIGMP
ncbi:hypothetical protein [Myceligenerans salitolerans]|uniref:Uncharacterized protein n=1 Tax=Myceligenerans salitolerans TaxID=1230528 RepID=A0ABS3IAU3_9MICO|nr:hypothetical protein [Myceligenerans salitolerans]MBO0610146.1 hypothetical protein [Myceligenerans salitolerans]